MPRARGSLFLARGTFVDSAIAAIVAYAGVVRNVDPCVVHVADDGRVHVIHRRVIEKVSVVPASAFIPTSEITESIDDPAIEANFRPPIPVIENKGAAVPSPIRRGPIETDFRSQHPCAGHPVVIIIAPSPISGSPDIAVTGTNGLFVNRQQRRSNGN